MKFCVDCGCFVRQWTDKDGVTHYQCVGCGKTGEKKATKKPVTVDIGEKN